MRDYEGFNYQIRFLLWGSSHFFVWALNAKPYIKRMASPEDEYKIGRNKMKPMPEFSRCHP